MVNIWLIYELLYGYYMVIIWLIMVIIWLIYEILYGYYMVNNGYYMVNI